MKPLHYFLIYMIVVVFTVTRVISDVPTMTAGNVLLFLSPMTVAFLLWIRAEWVAASTVSGRSL